MQKIVQLLSAAFAVTILASGAAFAATDQNCSITGPTGPDSVNTCTNNESNTININCTNELDVLYVNGQASSSGTATADSNTGAGSVTSGSANNTNFNTNTDTLTCGPAVQASTGGQGGGSTTPPPATTTSTPAPAATTLPATGSDSKVAIAAIATASFIGIAAAVRFGSKAFSKLV